MGIKQADKSARASSSREKGGSAEKEAWKSDDGYWIKQSKALIKAKTRHRNWQKARKSRDMTGSWKRVTLTLPRAQAKQKAKEFFSKYPKAAYWSEIESWRVLPDDVIEFTMRRLPSAD